MNDGISKDVRGFVALGLTLTTRREQGENHRAVWAEVIGSAGPFSVVAAETETPDGKRHGRVFLLRSWASGKRPTVFAVWTTALAELLVVLGEAGRVLQRRRDEHAAWRTYAGEDAGA